MKWIKLYSLVFLLAILHLSCKKFLEAKPDQTLSTPSTLKDLRAILDRVFFMNRAMEFTNTFSDEYYLGYTDWLSLNDESREAYTYAPKVHVRYIVNTDWFLEYHTIFYANTVLDNLKKIPPEKDVELWNDLKGEALFFRAYHFFELAQLYARQYDAATAKDNWGIVLRLTSDFNKPSKRASLEETYEQILGDLKKAILLLYADVLPVTPAHKTRPGKIAAYAMLARVYLQMGDYPNALKYAGDCLNIYDTLVDYNELQNTLNPFPQFFPEVIFYTNTSDPLNIFDWMISMDSTLYESYSENDLRKRLYYRIQRDNRITFKGSYNGRKYDLFNGIATDEVYLIRAECYARLGQPVKAMNDLNRLLKKRWVTGTFVPYTAADKEDALIQILNERRKELVNRGTRWSDIKRLNKYPGFAITLKRVLNGNTYTLPPDDPRFAVLIPDRVIELTGIQQNKR